MAGVRSIRFAGAGLIAALLLPATAAAGPPTKAQLKSAMDKTDKTFKAQRVGMCLGAIDHGVQAIKCYGTTDPAQRAHVPTASTLFNLASITKTVTATEFALAIKNGLKPRTPVKQLVTPAEGKVNFPANARFPANVTLLDYAQYFGGLPRDPENNTIFTLNDLIVKGGECYTNQTACFNADPECRAGIVAECKVAAPGAEYHYSNWAFALLGNLLGRRAGISPVPTSLGPLPPWELDARAKVLLPLGMTHTATRTGFAQRGIFSYWQAHHAVGVLFNKQPWEPPSKNGEPAVDPAAGLWSDSNDMMRWLKYSMTGTGTAALKQAHRLLFDTATRGGQPFNRRISAHTIVGLAWNVTSKGGYKIVNKAGGAPGFSLFMSFLHNGSRGVFVLVNNIADPGPLRPFSAAIAACSLMQRLPPRKPGIPCPGVTTPVFPTLPPIDTLPTLPE
jgi:CubicO group peptidase (beta-lactamase class C family)